MPSMPSSRFSLSTHASTSACVLSAASLCSTEAMPTRSQARRLPLMYEALAGSSPTSTTARHGGRWPPAASAATSRAICSRSSCASARPSTTTVRTGPDAALDKARASLGEARNITAEAEGTGERLGGRGLLALATLLGRLAGRVALRPGVRLALGSGLRLGSLGGLGVRRGLRAFLAARLLRLGRRVEVVVPAAALQHERRSRDLAPRLERAAARALLDRRLADALLALELVAASLAGVLVDRHRVLGLRTGAVGIGITPASPAGPKRRSGLAQLPLGRVR